MKKKSFILLTPILLALTTPVYAEQVYCPPDKVIHCTNGACSLDAPYSDAWSISVVGMPTGNVFFGAAAIQNPPAKADCMTGSSYGNFLHLYSNLSYSPDTSAAGSQWVAYPGNMYICQAFDVRACPMK